MAKTFDSISEASATNYLLLFAQRTLALQNEPPTPPPLNALGLPYHAIRAMRKLWLCSEFMRKLWLWKCATAAAAEEVVEAQRATADKARSCTGSWSFSTASWSFYTALDFAEKITPLAVKVTKYIQDDAAQEDRWRTTMKRETMKRFCEQREASDTQCAAIAEIRKASDTQCAAIAEIRKASDTQCAAIAEIRVAVDEVHQLIKKLANANSTCLTF